MEIKEYKNAKHFLNIFSNIIENNHTFSTISEFGKNIARIYDFDVDDHMDTVEIDGINWIILFTTSDKVIFNAYDLENTYVIILPTKDKLNEIDSIEILNGLSRIYRRLLKLDETIDTYGNDFILFEKLFYVPYLSINTLLTCYEFEDNVTNLCHKFIDGIMYNDSIFDIDKLIELAIQDANNKKVLVLNNHEVLQYMTSNSLDSIDTLYEE